MFTYKVIKEIIFDYKWILMEHDYRVDFEDVFTEVLKMFGFILILPFSLLADIVTLPIQIISIILLKIRKRKEEKNND